MLPSSFLTGFVLGFSLILAIGAQNAFVLRQGLLKQHVFPVVLFCAVSDMILIVAGIGGVSLLIADFAERHAPTMFKGDAMIGEAVLPFCHRHVAEQTQIDRPRHRPAGMRNIGRGFSVNIDFLIAKTERAPRRAAIGRIENLQFHAKHIAIEGDSAVDIGGCQNDMVDGCDHDNPPTD